MKQKLDFSLLLIAFTILLLNNPYSGIRHDGLLYAAQALKNIDPKIFSYDLFFKYGSQDSFSIFGKIYGFIVAHVGFYAASAMGVLLAQALFFLCCFQLARSSVPEHARAPALLLVFGTSTAYGHSTIIHYAEPFLTARTYAEVLVLLGIVFLIRRHVWLSILSLAIAAIIHPVMALPGAILFFLWQSLEDRRWLWLLSAVPLALLAGLVPLQPFDRLHVYLDAEWLQLVHSYNYVFMSDWPLQSWLALGCDFAILGFCSCFGKNNTRRLAAITLSTLALCSAASLIGADFLSNAFFASLQLWRGQWLCHVIALVLLSPYLINSLNQGSLGRLSVSVLVYGLIFKDLTTGTLAVYLGIVLLTLSETKREPDISKSVLLGCCVLLVFAAFYNWKSDFSQALKFQNYFLDGSELTSASKAIIFLKQPYLAASLLAFFSFFLLSLGSRGRRILMISMLFITPLSIAAWDRRPEISRIIEETPINGPYVFGDFVPPSAEVYWQGEALAPWLLMHRKSYVSGIQAAGIVFNRGTAMELERRREVTAPFDAQKEMCGLLDALRNQNGHCTLDILSLVPTCQADQTLDFIVTSSRIEPLYISSWTPPLQNRSKAKTYYLYKCAHVLQQYESMSTAAKS